MEDELWKMMIELRKSLKANNITLFWEQKEESKPVMVAFFTKKKAVIKFELDSILSIIEEYGYDKAYKIIKAEIEKILTELFE